jgi:hypothetical protein
VSTLLIIAILGICLSGGWLEAKTYLAQPQALQTAFPSYQVERKTLFLTSAQVIQIEQVSGIKPDSLIYTYYVARSSAGVAGIAFFDRRIVRSMPVTYMAVVNPSGTINYVDILSFDEPEDYLPPARWLALYKNRALDKDLAIGRSIPHITGASLTSQAMNDGIRLILAIYQVGVQGTL